MIRTDIVCEVKTQQQIDNLKKLAGKNNIELEIWSVRQSKYSFQDFTHEIILDNPRYKTFCTIDNEVKGKRRTIITYEEFVKNLQCDATICCDIKR
jgi:hypothetical protein